MWPRGRVLWSSIVVLVDELAEVELVLTLVELVEVV